MTKATITELCHSIALAAHAIRDTVEQQIEEDEFLDPSEIDFIWNELKHMDENIWGLAEHQGESKEE